VFERAARLLEDGGCAALRVARSGLRQPDLRVVVLDDAADPVLAILRKEA
jgi:Holliday junction resolvase